LSTRDFFTGPLLQASTQYDFPIWPKPYRLLMVGFVFGGSAAVANRVPVLRIQQQSSNLALGQWSMQNPAGTFPAANGLLQCTFAAGAGTLVYSDLASPATGTGWLTAPIPDDLIIWPSMKVNFFLQNGQIGDTISNLVATIDQEPWRPGYYTPDLPRARRKPKRGARAGPESDEEGFPG
jgi:hypothetical protein